MIAMRNRRGRRCTQHVDAAMPWDIADCVGYWAVPPYGRIATSGSSPVLVDIAYDMQRPGTYPTGKTAAFDLAGTGATRPQLVSGEMLSPTAGELQLVTTAAELRTLAGGEDTPWTFLLVGTAGTEINGQSGPYFTNGDGTHQSRLTQHQTAFECTLVRYDGTHLYQKFAGTADTERHVLLAVFDGTNFTCWDEDGQVSTGDASSIDALTFTLFKWNFFSAAGVECAMWARALNATERQQQIERAARRWQVPLP